MNDKWCVYLHIIPKEINDYNHDKYYVGIAKVKPEKRWEKNGMGYKSQFFYKAIEKLQYEELEKYLRDKRGEINEK